MKKLLSLPPNLVDCFHDITGYDREEWFCTNDPVGHKLGSGGGSAWLLKKSGVGPAERRLLLHAGGQSRRLPSYAPSGKVLTPIPVFRWERGQRLSQDLLSLQIPLYERIMDEAPEGLRTMIVSGDVLIRATEPLQKIPDADVVCYGLWLGADIAKDHGVFVSSRKTPTELKCMLQKPSVETLNDLQKGHFYLTDIGIWLLSDRAVDVLMRKSLNADGSVHYYDLYGEFGCGLGTDPTLDDEEVNSLRVAVLPLPGGEFYHFGTSHELLSSTIAIQNLVNDQREIIHRDRKPHPSIFVQNAMTAIELKESNQNVWIENACVGRSWTIDREHIITGVPENDFTLVLRAGQCVDVVPVGETGWVVRPYGFMDKFRGSLTNEHTEYLGRPFVEWAEQRGVSIDTIEGADDLQSARIFPVVDDVETMGKLLRWMVEDERLKIKDERLKLAVHHSEVLRDLWLRARKMSADEISAEANLQRLTAQRRRFREQNWPKLAANYQHSVFYQIDLENAAQEFAAAGLELPQPLPDTEPLMTRIHDAMFRAEMKRNLSPQSPSLSGRAGVGLGDGDEQRAFGLLRQGLTGLVLAQRPEPRMSVYGDQIVWGRCPVRIDLAGGWTDTPPYCLMEGGNVLNIAIELNGQQPLQAYVKPCRERHIVLRSIDLGASEIVTTRGQLTAFNQVGSPFSIPKAALYLAGFGKEELTLEQQLQAFGCGIEVTLLSAIPAGSGLGTSSLLAATVLGALNDFCGLGWDKTEIGHRTLVLEQLLTTGGGWQDQFGGLLHGVKLLQTPRGFVQSPTVRWLPDSLFTLPEYRPCHLLYYTGITRTAKKILAEIVRRMFLNQHDELTMLREMKAHAQDLFEAIQREDFIQMGRLIRKTWMQNQAIDSGTNPPEVARLTALVDDLCLGYKLPGAGGGGYLYMVAKDPEAAARIRQLLSENRQNKNARFVDMSLSQSGLQVSRS